LGDQRFAQLLFQASNELCISQWPSRSLILAQGFILPTRYPTRKKFAQSSTIFSNGVNHKRIITCRNMGARTTPGIFSWVGRQLFSDRIQFNISRCCQQIIMLSITLLE
jgi:hypothetical protein